MSENVHKLSLFDRSIVRRALYDSLVKLDPGHIMVSKFWQDVRQWLDQDYPQAALVSEWSNPSEAIPAGFHMDFTLHFNMVGYTSLFRKPYSSAWSGGDRYGASFFEASGKGNIRQFLDDATQLMELLRRPSLM